MRIMMMHKNDANTEAGKPPPMEIVQKMGEFIGGHAQAARLGRRCGTRRQQDAHAARLSRREAIAICRPYAEILGGTLEIDVRVVDQSEE
jgi:hypothetical protein